MKVTPNSSNSSTTSASAVYYPAEQLRQLQELQSLHELQKAQARAQAFARRLRRLKRTLFLPATPTATATATAAPVPGYVDIREVAVRKLEAYLAIPRLEATAGTNGIGNGIGNGNSALPWYRPFAFSLPPNPKPHSGIFSLSLTTPSSTTTRSSGLPMVESNSADPESNGLNQLGEKLGEHSIRDTVPQANPQTFMHCR